jgi:hypothetical protein
MSMKHILFGTIVTVAVLVLDSCSEPVKTAPATVEAKTEPAGPPQPVTAKTAFWAIYKPAHAWAADLQLISMTAGEVAGVKNADGKAGLWTIVIASPSLQKAQTYTYAVAHQLPAIPKGLRLASTVPWGGPTSQVMAIPVSEFSIDSDAAYQAALAKASDWLKKHPDKQSSSAMVLGSASRFHSPTWYFLWGNKNSGFEAFINATTGTAYK